MKRNEDLAYLCSFALLTQPFYSGFITGIYIGEFIVKLLLCKLCFKTILVDSITEKKNNNSH